MHSPALQSGVNFRIECFEPASAGPDAMRILFVTISIFLFSIALSAQPKVPRILDTIPDVPCGDAIARLDYFFTEITDEGPNVIGIAVYDEGNYLQPTYAPDGEKIGERPVAPVLGEAQQRIRWLQNYVNFRNFPKDKIRFVSGGYREHFAIDLWIVSAGSHIPERTPTKEKMKFRKGKFTEFHCVA